jgi:hypothetical protein
MSDEPLDKWTVLPTLPVVEEADYLAHMTAFVAAFVQSQKRERWHWLLTTRPDRIGRQSHKLHADLDRRTCRLVEYRSEILAIKGRGVYYEFFDRPRWIDVATAAGFDFGDAILSLVPGKRAIFFFHEYEIWLCESK